MADIKNSYIRPKKEDTIVYGRIVSASTEGVVADAGQIYDEQLKIGQHELNKRIIKSGIGSLPEYLHIQKKSQIAQILVTSLINTYLQLIRKVT